MDTSTTLRTGQSSPVIASLALLVGSAPVLLDLFVPPWGVPTALVAIWLILKMQGRSLADAGVKQPPQGWPRMVFIGLGGGLLLLAVEVTVYPIILGVLGLPGQDVSAYGPIEGNNSLLALYLGVSWTTAGFGEELIFRGFLMVGLARLMGMTPSAWATALVVTSVLFGLLHLGTGPGGVVTTGLHGALLAALFLVARRVIWAPYIAHGLANTIALLLIYYGIYEQWL